MSKEIRENIINDGIKKLQSYGCEGVDRHTILSDITYVSLFGSVLDAVIIESDITLNVIVDLKKEIKENIYLKKRNIKS